MRENHHCQFKCHGVVEFPDVQPERFFQAFQPVYKRVAVQIKLSGGFGDIQVVFVKFLDGILRFFVLVFRNRIAKDLI